MANQINPELLNRLTTWFNPATTLGQKQALAPNQFAAMWGPGGEGGTETRSLYGDNGYFDQGTNSTYVGGGGGWAGGFGDKPKIAFSGYNIGAPNAGQGGSMIQNYGADGSYLGDSMIPKRSAFDRFMASDLAANLIFGGGILGAGALVGAGMGGAAGAAAGAGSGGSLASGAGLGSTGASMTGGIGSGMGAGYGIGTLPELAGASYGASGLGLDAAMAGMGAAGAAGGAAGALSGSAGGNLAGGAGGDVLADATPGSFNAAADSQAANQALGLDAYSAEIPSVTVNGAPGGSFLDGLSSAAGNLFGGSGTNTIGNGGGFNWGSLIGPGLSAVGGVAGANASTKAAEIQAQAAREAQAQFKPWIDNGAWGMNQLGTLMGRNGPDAAKAAFTTSPDYQWRLSQGEKAATRAAATAGRLGSGKYLKDLTDYGQNQASQEFGNTTNRLLGLAGMGQTATGSSADYGTQGASARAAGAVGSANAITNAIGQGMSMYNTGQQQQQNNLFQNALMNRWLGGN